MRTILRSLLVLLCMSGPVQASECFLQRTWGRLAFVPGFSEPVQHWLWAQFPDGAVEQYPGPGGGSPIHLPLGAPVPTFYIRFRPDGTAFVATWSLDPAREAVWRLVGAPNTGCQLVLTFEGGESIVWDEFDF
jgi:hypothetical protein